ncbi:DUF4886 domain-containing protein [uncultured Cohaesibacter sp.]|uniref:DUF4886 domain-containing protein n=1 Tax=uncultured Cohaesibacter sp. TaxID=1002546 RepID=UPI0029C61B48|nr:hypothetical protein [uncultured Cohaesibacter sp.]
MIRILIAPLALTATAALASTALAADTVLAPSPEATMGEHAKVIALYGNSYTHYNNNLNTRLRDLTRSLLPDNAKGYSFRGITISSATLGWHLPNLEFQNGLKHWDAVIFQGNSTEPISSKQEVRQAFDASATQMSKIAHESGSRVIYFMTWAAKDKPEQTEELEKAYYDVAAKTGGHMAPVGLAFANARETHPEIELYFVDGKHPSLAGTYLAACVFFATLYDQSPIGGAIPIGSDMSADVAQALQAVAWDTVKAFRKQP